MADEDLSIAAPEQATPAIEPVQIETEQQTVVDEPERIPDPGEEMEAGTEAPVADDDFEDIEWNGKTFKAPKGLKDGVLMQADYTKKTQTVAEKAKALEQREAQIAQQAEATEEELRTKASLITIDERLEAYGKLTKEDWAAHRQADYIGTEEAWREYQELKQTRGEIAKTLETKQAERTQKAELDLATRVEETRVFAEKEIPGWKPELTEKLVKFALDNGVPEGELKRIWSPTVYKLLHRAQIGESVIQKQATAQKLPTAPVEPLATVGGKSTPGSRIDLASTDDMDAYVAARKRGVGGKPLR